MTAHRVGEAVDPALFVALGLCQQALHAQRIEQPAQAIDIALVAPILEHRLVIFALEYVQQPGGRILAEEERQTGHPRQVVLLVTLDLDGGEQVVDADPIAQLVGFDEVTQIAIELGVGIGPQQLEPEAIVAQLLAQDLVVDRLLDHRRRRLFLQAGEGDLAQIADFEGNRLAHQQTQAAW